MKRNCLCLFLLLGLLSTRSHAQRFSNNAGVDFAGFYGNIPTSSETVHLLFFSEVFSYFPKINIIQTDNTSVSLGAPLGFSFFLFSRYINTDYASTYDNGFVFTYALPLVMDLNIGAGSTPENPHRFGGYVGGGYDYYRYSLFASKFSNFRGSSHGPIFRIGFRSANRNGSDRVASFGAYYIRGTEINHFSTIGLSITVNIPRR